MDKLFLERRQFLLNEYLENLLQPDFIAANPSIKTCVFEFFDRGSYKHTKGVISRKVLFFPTNIIMHNFISYALLGRQSCKSIVKFGTGTKCYFGSKVNTLRQRFKRQQPIYKCRFHISTWN